MMSDVEYTYTKKICDLRFICSLHTDKAGCHFMMHCTRPPEHKGRHQRKHMNLHCTAVVAHSGLRLALRSAIMLG